MNKAITMKKTIRDDDGRDLLRIASDTLPDAGHKAIDAFYTKSDRDFQQSCEKLLLPRAKRDSAERALQALRCGSAADDRLRHARSCCRSSATFPSTTGGGAT